jgi:hypothetical protein
VEWKKHEESLRGYQRPALKVVTSLSPHSSDLIIEMETHMTSQEKEK